MSMNPEWETVADTSKPALVGRDIVQRLRIEHGWLYRNAIVEESAGGRLETVAALCFVPASR